MNDAYLGGSKTDISDELRTLAKELQEAAAEAWIRETIGSHHLYFTETTADASSDATHNAQGDAVYVDQSCDGIFYVKNKGDLDHPDRHKYAFVPHDSEAWKNATERFLELREGIERIADYEPKNLTPGALSLGDMTADLEMDTFDIENEEELEKMVNSSFSSDGKYDSNGGNGFHEGIFPEGSDWQGIKGVVDALKAWDGVAIEVFRIGYAQRLTSILIGQLAIVMTLKKALELENAILWAAKEDAKNVANAYIDAFEAGVTSDLDIDAILTVLETVGEFASHGSKVPQKHVQLASKIGGYITDGTSFARTVADFFDLDLKAKQEESSVGAESAEVLADNCYAEILQIEDTVTAVEEAGAEVIHQFLEVIRSDGDGVSVDAKWVKVNLTIRQSFFEPGISDVCGPALDQVSESISDSDPTNDPTYDSFRDSDVMGPAPDEGASFGADLAQLYRMGTVNLPQLAGNYSALLQRMDGAASPDGVRDGFQRGAGTGTFYEAWCELHSELVGIFTSSESTLNSVGTVLAHAAEAYTEQDEEAAAEIRDRMNELPWE